MVYLFGQLEPDVRTVPVPLYVDNSGVIALVFNPVDHQANKHVRISYHYARELTELKVIAPQRVASADNLADIFTKPLGLALFRSIATRLVSALVVGNPVEGKPQSRGGQGAGRS